MGHIQNTISCISKLFHRHKVGNETPGALQTKTENLAHFYTLGKLQSQDFHSIISDMEHQSLHQND